YKNLCFNSPGIVRSNETPPSSLLSVRDGLVGLRRGHLKPVYECLTYWSAQNRIRFESLVDNRVTCSLQAKHWISHGLNLRNLDLNCVETTTCLGAYQSVRPPIVSAYELVYTCKEFSPYNSDWQLDLGPSSSLRSASRS